MVCLMIANLGVKYPKVQIVTDIVMWVALALTVISLVDYLVKNKGVMKEQK